MISKNAKSMCAVVSLFEKHLNKTEQEAVVEKLKPYLKTYLSKQKMFRIFEAVVGKFFHEVNYPIKYYIIENLQFYIKSREGFFMIKKLLKTIVLSNKLNLLFSKNLSKDICLYLTSKNSSIIACEYLTNLTNMLPQNEESVILKQNCLEILLNSIIGNIMQYCNDKNASKFLDILFKNIFCLEKLLQILIINYNTSQNLNFNTNINIDNNCNSFNDYIFVNQKSLIFQLLNNVKGVKILKHLIETYLIKDCKNISLIYLIKIIIININYNRNSSIKNEMDFFITRHNLINFINLNNSLNKDNMSSIYNSNNCNMNEIQNSYKDIYINNNKNNYDSLNNSYKLNFMQNSKINLYNNTNNFYHYNNRFLNGKLYNNNNNYIEFLNNNIFNKLSNNSINDLKKDINDRNDKNVVFNNCLIYNNIKFNNYKSNNIYNNLNAHNLNSINNINNNKCYYDIEDIRQS